MNSTTAFEMPQDCFNIVKDYMGIVSVPTPVWNKLMNISIKELKGYNREVDYPHPFPKGTDLRKVSKKQKLQRYWCGVLADKKYYWFEGIKQDLINNQRHRDFKFIKKSMTERNQFVAEHKPQAQKDFITKARIFQKLCINGDFEDDGFQYLKPLPHLWGNFEATDYSIVMCMWMCIDLGGFKLENICLGGDRGDYLQSIKEYEKKNKIDYTTKSGLICFRKFNKTADYLGREA
jgi:hypothetical protein